MFHLIYRLNKNLNIFETFVSNVDSLVVKVKYQNCCKLP